MHVELKQRTRITRIEKPRKPKEHTKNQKTRIPGKQQTRRTKYQKKKSA